MSTRETPRDRALRFFAETPEPEGTLDEVIARAEREAAGEFAWREANYPAPKWGWAALPEDEREMWMP